MKRKIRLTEGDLHRIIKESVTKVLNEEWHDPRTSFESIDGKYSFKNLEVIIRGSHWGEPRIEYRTPHEGSTHQGLWGRKFMELYTKFYQETQDKEQSIYKATVQLFKPRF